MGYVGINMKRIFIDAEKCDGCKNCTLACMDAHQDGQGGIYSLDLQDPANESRNFIRLDGNGGYSPIFCRHCDAPDCVGACMSGAMTKNSATGHVEYDSSRCAACFMCVMSCRYGLPKPDSATRARVIKCDFCAHREDGPSCVRSCPKKAIYVREV